jgi:hypothetical protein
MDHDATNNAGSALGPLSHRFRFIIGLCALSALVLLVYLRLLPGSFLMDDELLVKSKNPLVNGDLGVLSVWFQCDFPLSTLVFWLEWLVWGNNPAGYHAVNISLQALNAVLVWRLLARLKVPGSWLAALLLDVHPVCVNSVGRIAELKNLLAMPFFLLSFCCFLRYESLRLSDTPFDSNPSGQLSRSEPGDPGLCSRFMAGHGRATAAPWLALSLVSFVLALLSKTSTVMLPALFLCSAAWQRGRLTRHDLFRVSPYVLLAAPFGLLTVWFQKYQALPGAGEQLMAQVFWDRLAAAGRVLWFYLGKAFLPIDLNLIYAQWQVKGASLVAFLPTFSWCAVLVLFWWFRRSWGRHALLGLGCFTIALFPALGFFDSQFLTRWRVSDHLQYLPLIAPVSLAAAAIARLARVRFLVWLPPALVMALAAGTFNRAKIFSSGER